MVIKRSTNLYCFSFNPFQMIIIVSFLMTLRNALQNVLKASSDYMNYTSTIFIIFMNSNPFWNFDASFEEHINIFGN